MLTHWTQIGSRYYYIDDTVSVTQTMAKHYCSVLGGSLATIKDVSQQTEIQQLLATGNGLRRDE